MAAVPLEVQVLIDAMVQEGWLTARQSERVKTMVGGGGSLDDALTSLPILATRDLKQALAVGLKKNTREDRAPIPLAKSPAPPQSPLNPKANVELDPDLIVEDQDSLDTGEFEPLAMIDESEDSRPTESSVLRQPVSVPNSRDPKELLTQKVQEPAGSILPGEEGEDTSEIEPLAEDLDLDIDLDEFDFDHAAPVPIEDLDDDLILPDDAQPAPSFTRSASGSGISETDVSSLFDEAFESAENNAMPSEVYLNEEPAPLTLPLPINPGEFIRGKAPAPVDLATSSNDSTLVAMYDLLGESLVLGRRGLRLDLRRHRQNVALYDPDGKLEEERTLPSEVLAAVSMKVKQLARLLPHLQEPQRGYARVIFQGERGRSLVATDGSEPGKDVVTVYLLSE